MEEVVQKERTVLVFSLCGVLPEQCIVGGPGYVDGQ